MMVLRKCCLFSFYLLYFKKKIKYVINAIVFFNV